ncbi:MAG: hypothetical protein GX318_06745 [Clostridia bacterium]|nr:hypothetical protein [Clostridia bacterium]
MDCKELDIGGGIFDATGAALVYAHGGLTFFVEYNSNRSRQPMSKGVY